jgi:hypothetical protein
MLRETLEKCFSILGLIGNSGRENAPALALRGTKGGALTKRAQELFRMRHNFFSPQRSLICPWFECAAK